MPGYRGRPDLTRETFTDDGWLRTGDIGELDDDGYLSIVDRKKELIISAGGKNMSPANIESRLKAASPLIGSAVVIGDRRPYNVALIVLDPDAGAPTGSRGRDRRRRSRTANGSLSSVEQIKRFQILDEDVGARRRRADADDEAQAQADRARSTPPRSTRCTPAAVVRTANARSRDVGRQGR